MEDYRQLRKCGSTLVLGGIEYYLESVEGVGSSTIVYKASYPDSLNHDTRHQVYIKELFPLSPYRDITRAIDGSLLCGTKSIVLMEQARQKFLSGNQINLALLQLVPASIAGNYNSYEAYGTYYSVLTVHGGKNLLRYLESKGRLQLRESLSVMQHLLQALEVFHQHRMLHLDISPDNILLLPEQILLIDFNSAWQIDNPNAEDFSFSCKKGYSAPEVLLQNTHDIGPATDLYSCCAVWFHLLMGRRLTEFEQSGHLQQSICELVSYLQNTPQTAIAKTVQILTRGLHLLARKRYQTIKELQNDIKELINRIDGFGVTQSALWEASVVLGRKQCQSQSIYLPQSITGREIISLDNLIYYISQGERYLLIGSGGIGKSRLLKEIWKKEMAHYQLGKPVFLFLSLKDYQAYDGESQFIQKSILRMLHFNQNKPYWQDGLHALECLFKQTDQKGHVSVVLLLDGLNEAGNNQDKLLIEIESISHLAGVGILATDRTGAVLSYSLHGFTPVRLSPLTMAQVKTQLEQAKLPLPKENNVSQLLTTPMLLFLFLESASSFDHSEQTLPSPETPDELVLLYLDWFYRKAMRADSGNQGGQLCTRYILQILLPQIAEEMRRQNKSVLALDDLIILAQKSFNTLHSLSFGSTFPEYLGKTRLMLEKITDSKEWFDFTIREQLTERFGLLVFTPQGQTSLLHDNFLEPLAKQAVQNHRRLVARKCYQLRRRGFLFLVLTLTLGTILATVWSFFKKRTSYTEKENAVIYDSLVSLSLSLSVWSRQISAQSHILDQAAISDILDNQDSYAQNSLSEQVKIQIRNLSALYSAPLDSALFQSLCKIAETKPLFSLDLLQQLCNRCIVLKSATLDAMTYLARSLCDENSPFNSRDKRERLVNAYKTYLDAETQYSFYLLAMLMADMTESQQNVILESMTYMEAFDGFYDGPGSVAPERLSDGAKRALESLKDAQREMNTQGFLIDWPELIL